MGIYIQKPPKMFHFAVTDIVTYSYDGTFWEHFGNILGTFGNISNIYLSIIARKFRFKKYKASSFSIS